MVRSLFFLGLLLQLSVESFASTGMVAGRVQNNRGEKIVNAKIVLGNGAYVTVSDSSGFFKLDSIPVQVYTFSISTPGYVTHVSTVDLTKRSVWLDFDLTLYSDKILPRVNRKVLGGGYDQGIVNVGLHQGWRMMGEISFGLCDYYHKSQKFFPMWWLQQITIGTEFNFSWKKPLLGPKISYNLTKSLLGYGVDVIYYTDFDQGTVYVNPHVGFSWDASWNVWFGYNIPVMRNHMKSRTNRFTVTFAIPIYNTDDYDERTKRWRGKLLE